MRCHEKFSDKEEKDLLDEIFIIKNLGPGTMQSVYDLPPVGVTRPTRTVDHHTITSTTGEIPAAAVKNQDNSDSMTMMIVVVSGVVFVGALIVGVLVCCGFCYFK